MKSPLISGDLLYRKVFVGRDNELSQLKSAFDSLDTGQSVLMMVVGEPGIDKTAVCARLSDHVTLEGGKTLLGHCYEETSLSLPYIAFAEAIRSYVNEHATGEIRELLDPWARDLARIVPIVREKLNIELTGRKVNIKIAYFYRFENGKQVEVIPFMDRLLFYEQLGFTPPYAQ